MASKISGVDTAPVTATGAGRPAQRPQDAVGNGTGADSTRQSGQDVQITGVARQLADLDQKLRDLPDVDQERVSQLRLAVEQGTYSVKPQHIADQLLSMERTLSSLTDTDESAA